ncbi:hypothetical protein D3C71_1535870 [compost metagenome]
MAINHCHTLAAAQGHQGCKRDFRCIGSVGEHRFTEHCLPQCDAIQAACQFSIDPGFNAMSTARCMEAGVGFNHLGHDPGASLPVALLGSAGRDHFQEVVVYADLAGCIRSECLQGPAKRAMESEVRHGQDHSWIGSPPQDGLPRAVPGESALGIRRSQMRYIQRATGSQESGGGVVGSPCFRRVG